MPVLWYLIIKEREREERKMLKVYTAKYTFEIDGEVKHIQTTTPYLKEEVADPIQILEGNTFESLWQIMTDGRYALFTPGNCWKKGLFSKKRRIEFFTSKTKAWAENGAERNWRLTIEEKITKVSMVELAKLDEEQVMEYLKGKYFLKKF